MRWSFLFFLPVRIMINIKNILYEILSILLYTVAYANWLGFKKAAPASLWCAAAAGGVYNSRWPYCLCLEKVSVSIMNWHVPGNGFIHAQSLRFSCYQQNTRAKELLSYVTLGPSQIFTFRLITHWTTAKVSVLCQWKSICLGRSNVIEGDSARRVREKVLLAGLIVTPTWVIN